MSFLELIYARYVLLKTVKKLKDFFFFDALLEQLIIEIDRLTIQVVFELFNFLDDYKKFW